MALTAAISLFVAEPADDVVAAAVVAALAFLFAELLALTPVVNVAPETEIPVAEVISLGRLLALAAVPAALEWRAGVY